MTLTQGEAIAIIIPEYCSPTTCADVSGILFKDDRYGEYENVPGVHKWGLNTYEGLSSADRRNRYFADVVPTIRSLRSTFAPRLSPIDKIRLELQESWPGGANLEFIDDERLFVGQARVFEKGHGAEPHQDFLPWETAGLSDSVRARAFELAGQLTVNIYLQVPEVGGEVDLWTTGYDYQEYQSHKVASDHYALRRADIPPPAATIKPVAGMLLMFHATRPHAVRPSPYDHRVALSCFVGIRDRNQPLTYWS